jgi:hypothetical protein
MSKSDLKRHTDALHSASGMCRKKKEEERINKLLINNSFTATGTNKIPLPMHFCREQHVDFKCIGDLKSKFARLDFVITLNNGLVVFLEVDENQHRFGIESITCDVKRMSHIQESLLIDGAMHCGIVFMRYNPGSYRVGDELQSIPKECREKRLLEHLDELGSRTTLSECGTMEIQYAYYDRYYGDLEKPEICWNLDYPKSFNSIASCVCL